jgi:hypothetical protein
MRGRWSERWAHLFFREAERRSHLMVSEDLFPPRQEISCLQKELALGHAKLAVHLFCKALQEI